MQTYAALLLTLLLGPGVLWSQHPSEKRFASMVSETILQRHVGSLVKFGNRWGGTPSGNKAAEYVAARFLEYGLDVEVIEDPVRAVYVHSAWGLRIVKPARLGRVFRYEWLAGFSPAVSRTTARLVDLEADIPESDINGSVVLTDKFVPGDLYNDLVAEGAVAVLSFAPGDSGRYSDWAMITHLEATEKNTIPLFNISFRNGMKLRREMAGGGAGIEVEFSARTQVSTGSPRTVVGTLKGSSDTFRIICAHGDSDAGGPGADDNASGVAGVLELARVLSRMVNSGSVTGPRESIKFIAWGAEYYSTENFVKDLGNGIQQVKSVINFDEIGFGATRNCLYFESNDEPQNEELLTVLNAVGEEYVGEKGFWDEATTNPSQGGTDSYVFFPAYLERLNVPAVSIPSVTVYTAAWNELKTIAQTPGWSSKAWKGHPDSVTIDFSPYYHSSRDIPGHTTEKEPFNMVWAVKATGIATLRVAWGRGS